VDAWPGDQDRVGALVPQASSVGRRAIVVRDGVELVDVATGPRRPDPSPARRDHHGPEEPKANPRMSPISSLTPSRLTTPLLALALATAAIGCKSPCKEGKIDAAWEAEPFSKLRAKEGVVCEGSTADTLVLWKPASVHDANMEAVSAAQDNGWNRNDDNWYPKAGAPPTTDFNSPKWSRLSGPGGGLRIDVKEEGGGALITYKRTAADAP
jgi:hypothetical protein